MARFVFFSFAYDDVKNFKVNVVRNSWLLKNKEETFVDGSIWEKSQSKGESVLKKLIETGLKKTSVTAILIGENTANRRWVNYEIIRSFDRGNGIFGIHINRIKGKTGLTARGQNPLDRLGFSLSKDGKKVSFYELKNGKWRPFNDLKQINNKKSNTLYFENHWWSGNEYGKFFRFSDKFPTFCWDFDNGQKSFAGWIEEAAEVAGR
jgi:hypothetical protein